MGQQVDGLVLTNRRVIGPDNFVAVKPRHAGYARASAKARDGITTAITRLRAAFWMRRVTAGSTRPDRSVLRALATGMSSPKRPVPLLASIDMNLVTLAQVAGRRIIRVIAAQQFSGVERLPCSPVIHDSCGRAAISSTLS